MSEYSDDIILGTHWTEERWDTRKKQMADVWNQRSTEEQKKLIALLVAHAPEKCKGADLSVANRKI